MSWLPLKRIDFANMFRQTTARLNGNRETTNYGGDNFDADPELSLTASISWSLTYGGNLRWARDHSTAEFLASVENCRAVKWGWWHRSQ